MLTMNVVRATHARPARRPIIPPRQSRRVTPPCPMAIETSFPLLDAILESWKPQLGADLVPYRNHCYRMLNFTLALHPCSDEDLQKAQIAGAFHDLGIWSDDTIDYLPPSVKRARDYLAAKGLQAWSEEVELLVDEHHKLRAYKDPRFPLVEAFRKADLVDVSLGLVKFGLSGEFVRGVKAQFPNEGFHKRLMGLAGGWFKQHPLSPPPFLKW